MSQQQAAYVYNLFRSIGMSVGSESGFPLDPEAETLLQKLLTEAREGFNVGAEDGEFIRRTQAATTAVSNTAPD
jgi:hypothetical protein